ncbi:MAG: type III secretion inner membrane ring lipoprotein SctJ [Victivallales bacterium]|nr:type III secretion inner membrane ring lipoprotein SctJ [Victivallales bacterium]
MLIRKGLLKYTALCALLLAGCKTETTLHSQLEERQANLVIATLLDGGIDCRKVAGEENTWNVLIDNKDFAKAVNLLESKGLPRRNYMGISEVFKKSGMISSPTEERIRFMDALAQDLSRTIAGIDGVLDARVHIVLPENDPFAKNALPSSAAVAIRSRWNADVEAFIPQIKSLVRNSIEGLQYEKIAVTVFKDEVPKQ